MSLCAVDNLAMVFRHAARSDVEAVARLHALSWQDAYRGILSDDFLERSAFDNRLSLWRERLTDDEPDMRLVCLAVEGDALLGFVCVMLDEDAQWGALLDNLHVHPDAKGKGLGRQLMAKAAAWILERRPSSSMHLWVYDQNRPARNFYEVLGGVPDERVVHRAPDRTNVAAVRYVWRDLAPLLTRQ